MFVTTPHECFVNDDGFRLKPNIDELQQYTNYMIQLFDKLCIRHYVVSDVSQEDRCKFVISCIDHWRGTTLASFSAN